MLGAFKKIEEGRDTLIFLESTYSSVSQKHVSDTSKESTSLDKRLYSAHKLYNTAARLADANVILQSCYELLSSKSSTFLEKKQAANHLRVLLVLLIKAAAHSLNDAGKNLAPIGGCRVYHNRCESERTEKAKQQVLLHKRMK